ncbi:MAG: hypothetical protein RLZZ254_1121 [Actinomycetota bacterium]|jgi:hypothetical protein
MQMKKFIILAAAGIAPIGLFLFLPYGVWADLDNLPAHPLIVHGVIVLIPVVAIWTVLAMWKPEVLRRTFLALWTLSVVAALGVIAAKSSGDSLSAAVGLPNEHADAGNRMVPVSIVMAAMVLLVTFFSLVKPIQILNRAGRVLASIAAVAALPLTYVAGHTGAESVWEEQYALAQEPISAGELKLTIDEVARRNSVESCWTVVEGVVYDMTSFVARHPAGAGDIQDMCGKDASEDFLGEHQGQGEPEKWLATLRIGVLVD